MFWNQLNDGSGESFGVVVAEKKNKTDPMHIIANNRLGIIRFLQVLRVTSQKEQTPTTPSTWPRGGTARLNCCWGKCASVSDILLF